MTCRICKRSSCMEAFHSFEEQEAVDAIDDYSNPGFWKDDEPSSSAASDQSKETK